MLPLTFKAVNKFTGEEGPGVVFTVFNKVAYDKQDAVYNVCQSTGIKDCTGKEVFFGDALAIAIEYTYCLFWVGMDSSGSLSLESMGDYYPEWLPGFVESNVICGKIVGNRWEPIDVLQQRVDELQSTCDTKPA